MELEELQELIRLTVFFKQKSHSIKELVQFFMANSEVLNYFTVTQQWNRRYRKK